MSPNNIDRKDVSLDIILVDALSMTPYVTAIPSRVGKILNRASTYQAKTSYEVVDLSWATQCIINRTLLRPDSHERYQISTTDKNKVIGKDGVVDIYSIKVNAARIEVGDSVTFGKDPSILFHGRVMSIKHNTRTRKNMVEVKILVSLRILDLFLHFKCNVVTFTCLTQSFLCFHRNCTRVSN